MKTKAITAILLTLFLASMLSTAFNVTPVMANGLVPIVDGDVIPFGYPPELPITLDGLGYWDSLQIGLVVERGNGFVDIGLPDGISQLADAWGIHGYITLNDAEVTGVKDWLDDGTLATMSGASHVAYGLEGGDDGIASIGTATNPITNKDEVDWGTSWVEFWLAAWGGRDCFRVYLNYLTVDASMVITRMESYRIDTESYGLGPDSPETEHAYDVQLPLIHPFGTKFKLDSYRWDTYTSAGSGGVKYWYQDTTGDGLADYIWLAFHVTFFSRADRWIAWLGCFEISPNLPDGIEVMNAWGKIFVRRGPPITEISDPPLVFDFTAIFYGTHGISPGKTTVFADINGGSGEHMYEGYVTDGMRLLLTMTVRIKLPFSADFRFYSIEPYTNSYTYSGELHNIGSI